jgi:hypothetical protein
MLAVAVAHMLVQAGQEAGGMPLLTTLVRHRLRELPTQAVVVAAQMVMGQMVALALLFLLYQLQDTQAQPQAHQQSRQAVQTQF